MSKNTDQNSRIPLSVPDLRGNESVYLSQCVTENWVSSAGHFIGEFEAMIAQRAGTAHAAAVCNGTVAIKMALLACGVGPGDAVIVPDWTFIATANAIRDSGAEPIFVDVTSGTWSLDPELVAKTLDMYPDVKAIVAVHPLGYACDMDRLLDVAGDVPIIEDAAGAIGTTYRGRLVGGIGRVGCFSFNGNKSVTAGAGGAVTTNDADLDTWVRHVTAQARIGTDYRHDAVAYNYRMSNLNAAVGKAQMERFDEIQASKDRIAHRYRTVLDNAGSGKITAMPSPEWGGGNNWLFSVLCESEDMATALVDHFDARDIESRKFWRALSSQAPYVKTRSVLSGVSESLSGRVVSLPSSAGLSDAGLNRVADELTTFLVDTPVATASAY